MKEAFEKIIEKLEEECFLTTNDDGETNELSIKVVDLNDAIEIVKQVFEEYKDFDLVFAKKCVELAEKLNVCDLVSENCRLSRINRFSEAELEVLSKKNHFLEIALEAARQSSSGWILCNGNDKNFPADCERVRVTLWCGDEFTGYRKDDKWFVYGGCGLAEADVIAWQRAQPYQPSGDYKKKTNFDRCCESMEAMAQIIDIAKIGWTKDQIMEWLQKEECGVPE